MLAAIALLGPCAGARSADGHGMRSAYVQITQTAPDRARVAITGKVPVTGVELRAAAPCAIDTMPDGIWLRCPERLGDAALAVTGLGPVASEAVIFVTFLDGTTTSGCATASHPQWTIPGPGAGALSVASRYVALGIEHIASGADHLLFLLALVLCLRSLRAVMLAETAFTLSHTLSFSASALGWVHVSAAAAEACIAVSLVLVALDVGRARDASRAGGTLSVAWPWKTAGLAFAFGLVHGLGFAGGLAEIGLPSTAVPAALAGFAGGVEIGQVAFLAIALAALAALERAPRLARATASAGACAIGGIGWCWLLERLGALGS
ncbi:MAG TPA: HupE/UreJ family protein [Kofleriaceae bacterium]|nr:HupE/UreJ family protein [Kofleriaceae bacterium]